MRFLLALLFLGVASASASTGITARDDDDKYSSTASWTTSHSPERSTTSPTSGTTGTLSPAVTSVAAQSAGVASATINGAAGVAAALVAVFGSGALGL